MKHSIWILMIFVSSCSALDKTSFVGNKYRTMTNHMLGASYINFKNDSIFIYTERNGSLYTKGTWQLEGKTIILKSYNAKELGIGRFTGDSALYFSITGENRMRIKNSKKLIFKDKLFIIQK